jgi:hypothetical protein
MALRAGPRKLTPISWPAPGLRSYIANSTNQDRVPPKVSIQRCMWSRRTSAFRIHHSFVISRSHFRH